MADAGRKGRAFEEVGVTGLNRWKQYGGITGGQVEEDFLIGLRGTTGIKIFNEMSENDSMIGGILLILEQLLKQIPWNIEPAGKSDEAKADADFVDQCKADMDYSWSEFLDEVMTFLVYGWVWFEIVHKVRVEKYSRYNDGKIGWGKFAPRAQSSFTGWEFGSTGEVLGLYQMAPPKYERVMIPLKTTNGLQKSLHFVTRSRKRNPEGKSLLRNAYRSWYFKKRIEELEGIGVERDLTGLPMLTPPEGVELESERHSPTRAWAQKLIRNVRRGQQMGFVKPYGWEFELLPSPGQHPIDTGAIVSRYDKQIAMSCISQFLLLGMERIGSYAMAQASQDLYDRCLEGWALRITEVLNRDAIPSLFAINGWKRDEYPRFVYGTVTRESLKEVSSYINRLASAEAIDVEDEGLRKFLMNFGIFKNVNQPRG
jgi:hypothetical protein